MNLPASNTRADKTRALAPGRRAGGLERAAIRIRLAPMAGALASGNGEAGRLSAAGPALGLSAAGPALGYLAQVEYALLIVLQRTETTRLWN
jgi:hypothetical protein